MRRPHPYWLPYRRDRRNHEACQIQSPANDPNAAYDVVPTQGWPHGWTVICNGIPVRHFVNKTNAERNAMDAEYRASLIGTRQKDRAIRKARGVDHGSIHNRSDREPEKPACIL
jgi:hypothetical protein